MQIDKITAINDELQLVNVTISHGGDQYKYDMNTPVLEGDALQAHCDAREFKSLNNILYQVYDRNIQFEDEDKWDEWIADGCKIAEVSKEIPAVEAKDAVYEDVEVSPAGERQKVVVTEVEEEVTSTVIEKNSSGKYVEKEVTETVTKSSEEPQFEEVPLYHANGQPKKDDDGNPVMHKIPLMEEYEAVTERRLVSAAVEAKDAEQIIISPEKAIEKKAWVDSH